MNVSTEASGRHLLVVDDDNRIRALLKEYLARAGFRVTAASDAASARRLMETLDFDLLVLDVMMPGEDGFSLTRALRARSGAAGKTPVLLLTARGGSSDRIEGLSLGADDYLAKPFEPQELLLRIEAILRRAGDKPAAQGKLSFGGRPSILAIDPLADDHDAAPGRIPARSRESCQSGVRSTGGWTGPGAVADQVLDHRRIGQRGGVAQRAHLVLGDLAQNAPHDLARAGLGQAGAHWITSGLAMGPISARTWVTRALRRSSDGS